jgi:hypothetical protein
MLATPGRFVQWFDKVCQGAGREASRAMVVGLVGGPIVYLAVLIAAASALDSAHSTRVEALVAFMFPAICGIGMTLIPALVPRR